MKVYYHKTALGNFGDDLNVWLWPKVIKNLGNVRCADWLIGIGTILDDRLAALEGTKLIAGTGYRPGAWPPVVQENWILSFVRGPLTAAKYGLSEALAISDPAIMVAEHWKGEEGKEKKVGFMPHYFTRKSIDCAAVSQRAGVHLIDPCWDVEKTLEEISSLDRIIVEAMHGAIVADALGIPWIRIKALSWRNESLEVSDFKWADWAGALHVDPEARLSAGIPFRLGRGARIINPVLSASQVAICSSLVKYAKNDKNYQTSKLSVRIELIDKIKNKIASIVED